MTLATFQKTKMAAAALAVFGLASISSITQAADITSEYPAGIDTPIFRVHNIGRITFGPNGHIWFTATGTGSMPYNDYIGEIDPSAVNPVVVRHDIVGIGNVMHGIGAQDITVGVDGNLWFTEKLTGLRGAVGVMSPGGQLLNTIDIEPLGNSGADGPVSIISAYGSIWVGCNSNILNIDTNGGFLGYYSVPGQGQPTSFAMGPDNNIWFTSDADNKIYKIIQVDPNNGNALSMTGYTAGAGSEPTRIVSDGVGTQRLWFTEKSGNSLGEIDTGTGVVIHHAIPKFPVNGTNDPQPVGLVKDSNGAVWVALSSNESQNGSRIAKYIPASDTWKSFTIATADSSPTNMTLGPNNSVWFVESSGTGNLSGVGEQIAQFNFLTLPVSLQSFKVD